MPRPRKALINPTDTPYYHCVSRCVRRAFLCGHDTASGKSYEHRRQWVEQRILFLGRIFAIDICAYAVMHNHTHVVLSIDTEAADSWSDTEVLSRWHRLHKGMLCARLFQEEETRALLSEAELQTVKSLTAVYRKRLSDISWFMRELNEPIAKRANREDRCTGRFWEGRFKSQALLDETALAACMAYVDLNPVRAGIARAPSKSLFTSARKRLRAANHCRPDRLLKPFRGEAIALSSALPFSRQEYFGLLTDSVQRLKTSQPAPPSTAARAIMTRSEVPPQHWPRLINSIEEKFGSRISAEIARGKLRLDSYRDSA